MRWRKLYALTTGQHGFACLLFAVMVVVAAVEGFGLSLVIPLISSVMGGDLLPPLFAEHLAALLDRFDDEDRIAVVLVLLILVFAIKTALLALQSGLSTHFAMGLRRRWAMQIYHHYLDLPYARLGQYRHGKLLHDTVTETLTASKAIILGLRMLSSLVVSTVLVAMLMVSDAAMVLALCAGVALLVGLIWSRTRRYANRFGKRRLKTAQALNALVGEGYAGLRELKIHDAAARPGPAMERLLDRFGSLQTRFSVLSTLPNHAGELVVVVFFALLLTVTSWLKGESLEQLLPLLAFFIVVSQRLIVYLSRVVTQRMKVQSLIPALGMIYDVTSDVSGQRESDTGGTGILTSVDGDIALNGVSFAYEPGREVLRNVNLVLAKGEVTGLKGPSGSGKSTIADLLLGLQLPSQGTVSVAGRDLRSLNLPAWRRRVGYVGQDPFLFDATIKENVCLGLDDVGPEQVLKALDAAGLSTFIDSLPEGMDTIVGERGLGLSGGQKQRLSIARAIVRQPDLYVFDEATSALDPETEAVVAGAIRNLAGAATVLVIAHRTSTLAGLDRVFALDGTGNIRRAEPQVLKSSTG